MLERIVKSFNLTTSSRGHILFLFVEDPLFLFSADGSHIYSGGAPHPTLILYNLDKAEFSLLDLFGSEPAPPLEWDFLFFLNL